MVKILNVILCFLKMILLFVCFVFTFFILMNMYNRLEKNIIECIPTMLPFVLLLFLFLINLILRQKVVNSCLFYNIVCCFTFGVILFAVYRTFNDKNMLMILKLGYSINFNYFADFIAPMKVMLYLLSLANIGLIFSGNRKHIKKEAQ